MMRPFRNVPSAKVGRSVFDLSYSKLFTCDMGELIPVMHDEVVPGDVFQMSNEVVIRFMPLVAPILHEVNCYVHYFFVPYRLLWDEWETFISGGVDGDETPTLPVVDSGSTIDLNPPSLWNYLGMPEGILPTDAMPLKFPFQAYRKIYNDFYLDETLQTELDIDDDDEYGTILIRNWSKDYFTSALPFQQRGTAPSFPLGGTATVDFTDIDSTPLDIITTGTLVDNAPNTIFSDDADSNRLKFSAGTVNAYQVWANLRGSDLNIIGNSVDVSSLTTFDIADLRLAFQVQRWMERNARAGVRYTEFLRSHFNVAPRDERLQRAEYIGGSKMPVIVSEVLQTSETSVDSPQGTMTGHGITAGRSFVGSYRVQEYGLIMALMSVMPVPMYQQGINRQWLRQTKFDFYFPEFANLSEQAIELAEIYAISGTGNRAVFGYQGRYDEMRYKPNMVCGLMRETTGGFAHWHLGRIFGSQPTLGETFIQCIPDKRVFAVPEEPGLLVSFGNIIKAIRPMPIMSNPGLIDH